MMSILEDYDQEDLEDFSDLEAELHNLAQAAQTVELHGATPTTVSMLQLGGLLSTTAMSSLALESMTPMVTDPVSDKIALEDLTAKIREKMATWGTKILNVFKGSFDAVKTFLTTWRDKIKTGLDNAKAKLVDSAVAAKSYAKVHPYKTVMMAATAALAVIGLVSMVSTSLPLIANAARMTGFSEKFMGAISAIKWPGGPVVPKLISGGKKLGVTVAGIGAVAGAASLAKLGWSKISIEAIGDRFEKIANGAGKAWDATKPVLGTIIKDGWTMTKGTVSGFVEGFKAGHNVIAKQESYHNDPTSGIAVGLARFGLGVIGSGIVGFTTFAVSIFYVLYKLIKTIVFGAFRIGAATLRLISNAGIGQKEYV